MTTSNFECDAPTIHNHIARKVGPDVQRRIDALQIGQKMQDLPEELWHESFRYYVKEDPTRKGGPNLRMIRLHPDRPALTVTGYIFNKFVHPSEDRYITVREAARLQGFPDELKFEGNLGSTQLQVGNAVPIPLAHAVFQQVVRHARTVGQFNDRLCAFSLFSGAGGMDIGAEHAGISTKIALEFWPDACKTLRGYFRERITVVQENILTVTDPVKLWHEKSGKKSMPDIVYGGPPCQAFSQAGKQQALEDERGQLIFEFLRFVDSLRPSYFVMENVSNLKGVGGGNLYRHILDSMEALGYHVNVAPLLAANYGTAQMRCRLFFIGSKRDIGTVPLPEPTHSATPKLFGEQPYKTVGEAFAELPMVGREETSTDTYSNRPKPDTRRSHKRVPDADASQDKSLQNCQLTLL